VANVQRTDQAEHDLSRILWELAQESVSAGQRLVDLVKQKSHWYADRPDLGVLRDDLAPGLRCFIIWSYLIFYRTFPGGIELLRIIHGSRNIKPSNITPPTP
jgi:toxin ParE1/3/4